MKFTAKTSVPATVKTDCLILGIHTDAKLTPAAKAVDDASDKAIQALFKSVCQTISSAPALLTMSPTAKPVMANVFHARINAFPSNANSCRVADSGIPLYHPRNTLYPL